MGDQKVPRGGSASLLFCRIAVILHLTAAIAGLIGCSLAVFFGFIYGGVIVRLVLLAGLLLLVLIPRRSAASRYEMWHSRAFFAFMALCGFIFVWVVWEKASGTERLCLFFLWVPFGAVLLYQLFVAMWSDGPSHLKHVDESLENSPPPPQPTPGTDKPVRPPGDLRKYSAMGLARLEELKEIDRAYRETVGRSANIKKESGVSSSKPRLPKLRP
jgi:hypothetical protein